jgi:hypothetical protein
MEWKEVTLTDATEDRAVLNLLDGRRLVVDPRDSSISCL